jgi:hypothetical protein
VMTAVGRALNFHAADASADAKAGTPVARLGNHVFFTAAEHPLSIHGSPVRRLVQAEPATIEEGPGAAVAARRFTMALGDLGLFGKRETAAQPATESVASAAEVSTAASE